MSNEIQFLLYSLPDEEGKVQVVIKDETIWCTQKAMAQLFGIGIPAISKHLKNIFEELHNLSLLHTTFLPGEAAGQWLHLTGLHPLQSYS